MASVLSAVRRDLRALPEAKRGSGLAEMALKLAREIDARPTAALAKELRETLKALLGSEPVAVRESGVDELRARRAGRGA